MDLLLATRNPHKTQEFRELLGDSFEIKDVRADSEIPLPEETGSTFKENAILKAVTISKHTHGLVIADDSGLEVEALNGAPGIYSARYAGEDATDIANVDKLLRALKNVRQRSARFRCVIALARAGNILGTFDAFAEGAIVNEPRGNSGFGYDPVFQPAGFEQTFAEMEPELKNRISHRAAAAAALRKNLRDIED
jgi:XTP/dITP diphosphohydrolase